MRRQGGDLPVATSSDLAVLTVSRLTATAGPTNRATMEADRARVEAVVELATRQTEYSVGHAPMSWSSR